LRNGGPATTSSDPVFTPEGGRLGPSALRCSHTDGRRPGGDAWQV